MNGFSGFWDSQDYLPDDIVDDGWLRTRGGGGDGELLSLHSPDA